MGFFTEEFNILGDLEEDIELNEAGFLNNLKNKVGQGLQNAGQKLQGQQSQQQQQQDEKPQQKPEKRVVDEYELQFISTAEKYQLEDYIKSAPKETGIVLVCYGEYEELNNKIGHAMYKHYGLVASNVHVQINKEELKKYIDFINKQIVKGAEQIKNGRFPTIILLEQTKEGQREAPSAIYHEHPMLGADYKNNTVLTSNLNKVIEAQKKEYAEYKDQLRAENEKKNKHNEADFSGNNSRWSQNTNYDSQNYRPNSASDRNPYYRLEK